MFGTQSLFTLMCSDFNELSERQQRKSTECSTIQLVSNPANLCLAMSPEVILLPTLDAFALQSQIVSNFTLVLKVALSNLVASKRPESVKNRAESAVTCDVFGGLIGHSEHFFLQDRRPPGFKHPELAPLAQVINAVAIRGFLAHLDLRHCIPSLQYVQHRPLPVK